MTKLLVLLMFPLLLAGGLIACETEEQVAKKIEDVAPVFQLSAAQLFAEYEANEVAADVKYKDKVALISGVVDDIGKDFLDTPYITLVGGQFWGVQCMFADKEVPGLAKLSKGDTVSVKGKVDGMLVNVLIRGCTLQ
jgi:hypothetical protein